MKVSFCSTVCDVTPIVISLYLPETSKPIQDANFKRPRVYTIVAFDKRISKIVNGEMLQLPKRTVVEIQVIWITYTTIIISNRFLEPRIYQIYLFT